MQFYGKAESVATRIVEQFQTGNIPKALAPVFIKRKDDIRRCPVVSRLAGGRPAGPQGATWIRHLGAL